MRDRNSLTTGEETGDLVLDKPEAGKRWTAANPTSMYVSSLSWVAYPYGIPSDAKSCPYYKPTEESPPHHVMRGIPSENSSHYSEYTSSSTSSFSSSQSSASVESVQVPVPVDRTPEVAENFVSEKRKLFGWTGKNIQH